MKYLGIKPKRPKIAVFDFTGCEGCELQLVNKEETVIDFLGSVDVINFREISSTISNDFEVAFIEGAITRDDEINRLNEIREQAKVLIALGSCACFGGVNRLKNAYDFKKANQEVYGKQHKETLPARAVKEIIAVDLQIPGCPVDKPEVERIVQHLVWDVPYQFPAYPVCFECKQQYTTCVFELGQLCLGPVTQGGCRAPCPVGGSGCWGCRGPAADPHLKEFLQIADEREFSRKEINERLSFYSGFEGML
ncbi:MAG: NADH:ubiquinone oxidoreductase [Fidelibacterota bacterium]|nr:MAG: NADH:ubiquinone oxidoreductase [Candidatus Neomarinimicrobiota bacterium]